MGLVDNNPPGIGWWVKGGFIDRNDTRPVLHPSRKVLEVCLLGHRSGVMAGG